MNYTKKGLNEIYLIWCKQAVEVLEEKFVNQSQFSLLDIGCNYFQLWKELKQREIKSKCDYFGMDYDQNFLDIGLEHFPELREKVIVGDLVTCEIEKYDVIVCSAILEHLNNAELVIDKILAASSNIIIFRTFLGEKDIIKEQNNPKYVDTPYNINQFGTHKFINKILGKGFKLNIQPDIATNNSNPYKALGDPDFVRQMFFIVCEKIIYN